MNNNKSIDTNNNNNNNNTNTTNTDNNTNNNTNSDTNTNNNTINNNTNKTTFKPNKIFTIGFIIFLVLGLIFLIWVNIPSKEDLSLIGKNQMVGTGLSGDKLLKNKDNIDNNQNSQDSINKDNKNNKNNSDNDNNTNNTNTNNSNDNNNTEFDLEKINKDFEELSAKELNEKYPDELTKLNRSGKVAKIIIDGKQIAQIRKEYGPDFITDSLIGVGYVNNIGIISYGIENGIEIMRKNGIAEAKERVSALCLHKMNYGQMKGKIIDNFNKGFFDALSNNSYFLNSEKLLMLKDLLITNCNLPHKKSKEYIYNGMVKYVLEKELGSNHGKTIVDKKMINKNEIEETNKDNNVKNDKNNNKDNKDSNIKNDKGDDKDNSNKINVKIGIDNNTDTERNNKVDTKTNKENSVIDNEFIYTGNTIKLNTFQINKLKGIRYLSNFITINSVIQPTNAKRINGTFVLAVK